MCTHKQHIYNNTKHFNPESDCMFLDVPCSHCFECALSSRDEWFTRAYFEWQSHFGKGLTFFYTLTFADEFLPSFRGIPCFNVRLVQLFLKRLRKSLSVLDIKLKYIIVSEFGEQFGRPHHHALFFIDGFINAFKFYQLVRDAWQYGFVQYGKKHNLFGVVNSSAGIRYVTKYISKDFTYTDTHQLSITKAVVGRYCNVIDILSKTIGKCWFEIDKETCVVRLRSLVPDVVVKDSLPFYIQTRVRREIRSRLPFHLQSTKLGITALDSPIDFEKELLPILSSTGVPEWHSLPRYFKRKLWYDVVENDEGKKCLFRLNEAGKAHFMQTIEHKVNYEVSELKKVTLNTHLLDEDSLKLVNATSKYSFSSVEDLEYFVEHFDLDLEVMAIYSKCFRGRLRMSDFDLNNQVIKDSYVDYMERCIYDFQNLDFGELRLHTRQFKYNLKFYLWDNHEFFQPYEDALVIFEAIIVSLRTAESIARKHRESLSRNISSFFNPLKTFCL